MLRINLLPAYIAEQRRTRLAMFFAGLLFAGITAVLLAYHFGSVDPARKAALEEAATLEAQVQRVNELNTQIQAEQAKLKPIKDKVDFVADVRFHNTVRSKVFRNAARYTDRAVEYASMAANGTTLSMNAYVKSLDDLGRYYITMFGNPDVNAVSISGMFGWPRNRQQQVTFGGQNPFGEQAPAAASAWWPVQVVATLVRPIVTPQLPATLLGNQQQGMGMGGFGGSGMMPGMSGPPMGMSGPGMSGPEMGAPPTMSGPGAAPIAPDGAGMEGGK
jgi:hypothetical protein